MSKVKDIKKIVLTGGPCAGKSSALAMLREKLADYGVYVLTVPEVATMVFSNGIAIDDMTADTQRYIEFQKQILLTQRDLEDRFMDLARIQPYDRIVVICDRGLMDGSAYMDRGDFIEMAGSLGLSLADISDRRYDAVFHLVTAAFGAELFYNQSNIARYEDTIDKARATDLRTQAAWNGHEHLCFIGNTIFDKAGNDIPVSFDEKLSALLRTVCNKLGLPVPLEIERKFLIPLELDISALPIRPEVVEIEQAYLLSSVPGVERRVRRRAYRFGAGQTDGSMYVYTEKTEIRPGTRIERERIISSRDYDLLLKERDPLCQIIKKIRHSFIWKGQYFQLDEFHTQDPLILLEIELTDERQNVLLPDFLKPICEVTDDVRFKNFSIASGFCLGYR